MEHFCGVVVSPPVVGQVLLGMSIKEGEVICQITRRGEVQGVDVGAVRHKPAVVSATWKQEVKKLYISFA